MYVMCVFIYMFFIFTADVNQVHIFVSTQLHKTRCNGSSFLSHSHSLCFSYNSYFKVYSIVWVPKSFISTMKKLEILFPRLGVRGIGKK